MASCDASKRVSRQEGVFVKLVAPDPELGHQSAKNPRWLCSRAQRAALSRWGRASGAVGGRIGCCELGNLDRASSPERERVCLAARQHFDVDQQREPLPRRSARRPHVHLARVGERERRRGCAPQRTAGLRCACGTKACTLRQAQHLNKCSPMNELPCASGTSRGCDIRLVMHMHMHMHMLHMLHMSAQRPTLCRARQAIAGCTPPQQGVCRTRRDTKGTAGTHGPHKLGAQREHAARLRLVLD